MSLSLLETRVSEGTPENELNELLGVPMTRNTDVSLGQVHGWDQGGRLSAEGQGTWGLWAVATPGDVSPLGPSNPFVEPLNPG